jgi:hypothetical protein
MRIFEHPNTAFGWTCPICKTNEDSQVVLLSKYGTTQGNIIEAEQCHLECLDLYFYEDSNLIAMKIEARRG